MRSPRVSALARFGSAAAVAAVAVAGALAPVTAANAAGTRHHKAPTHLFVLAHFVRGSHHKSDVINGLLRSRRHGLAGETIVLESRTAHQRKFGVVGSMITNAHGLVSFTVTPTGRTFYKLVFAGDATHRATRSAVIVLRAPRPKK